MNWTTWNKLLAIAGYEYGQADGDGAREYRSDQLPRGFRRIHTAWRANLVNARMTAVCTMAKILKPIM